MQYFYKYIPLREDFFSNLMLRATPFVALNDPYEGQFSKTQLKSEHSTLNSLAQKQGIYSEQDSYIDIEDIMENLQDELNNVGVLSFSEDYANPLMWSHYANEHCGIAIEFDYDQPLFQDSIKTSNNRISRFGTTCMGDTYEFPEKVMYRKKKPSFERLEHFSLNLKAEYAWKDFLYTLFFTKSDDWIYEKELRSIVQLKHADRIICSVSAPLENVLKKNPEIKKQFLDNHTKVQITYPEKYEMQEDMGDYSVKEEIAITISNETKDNIHLFRINPSAITRIYCGYRCDSSKVKSLIAQNKQLSHLKNNIYQMEIDDSNYELKCRLLK